MSVNKRRDILDSRAREMLMRVNDYFVNERDECKNILKTLTCILKRSASNSEIVVSKQLLSDITHHFKRTNNITERVVKATGVNKNTVCTVRGEKAEAVATGTELKTPKKKTRGKKQFLDNVGLLALRNIVNSFYTERKDVPTLKKILAVARKDLDFKGSKSTLRKLLIEDLGYRFKKTTSKQEDVPHISCMESTLLMSHETE